jgi:site-specific DNA-methyltransferase (adenine-specific)
MDKPKVHPTQKPIALLEYLIKTYTNEGARVLDNCMGSGSTGVACKNLGRDFVGIEKEEKYFQIAKERIDSV